MTAIAKILNTGKSARSDEPIPTDQEVSDIETKLGFRFPASYREFVRLGGLSELRFKHRVLSPSEILASRCCLPDKGHVPFADNGCGDLYCWSCTDTAEPIVLFADHETEYTYTETASSFTQWLEKNRL